MLARILQTLLLVEVIAAICVGRWLADAGYAAWLATVAGITAPVSIHAAVIAADWMLARRRKSPTPEVWQLTPAAALRTWLVEVVLSLRTFGFAQPLLGHRPLASAAAGADSGAVPVVMIHGYFCNRAIWRPLARHLAARGHLVEGINLEPVFGSIDGYTGRISDAVERLRRASGGMRVALVCHSMGGLAARAFLRRHGGDGIAAVITLGTPHKGTYLASFGHGTNVRQMRLESPWIDHLEADERSRGQPPGPPFTTILTHHDNIVSPQAGQTVAGAACVELGGVGHIALAYDRRAWAAIDQQLSSARAPASALAT